MWRVNKNNARAMKRKAEFETETDSKKQECNSICQGYLSRVHSVLNVYKPVSLTPLEVITQLKALYPAYQKCKIGYAGRLDPMARGILLCLVDDENKKRKDYEFYTKEYIFRSALGARTDTYDIMGLLAITKTTPTNNTTESATETTNKEPSIFFQPPDNEDLRAKIQSLIDNQFIGRFQQPYPPYSSARVNGKLMFQWAREGKLDQIEIPSKEVEVMSMEILSLEMVSLIDLYNMIEERISAVTGDFRQTDILEEWKKLRDNNKGSKIPVVEIKVNVSHGTYVRSLSHELGNKLGSGAVVVDLLRTRVHDFHLEQCIKLA